MRGGDVHVPVLTLLCCNGDEEKQVPDWYDALEGCVIGSHLSVCECTDFQ